MAHLPQDVYAKCLPIYFGYPLWNPGPSGTLPSDYKLDGFQIGDVGIVDPDHGFEVLFNICKQPCHELHNRRRISQPSARHPGGTIKLASDDIVVGRNNIVAGSVVSSAGVQRNHRFNEAFQRAAYEFTVLSSEGALLILPDGATLHDLKDKTKFRDLAKEDAVYWYHFVAEDLQREISNGSLYLITGFYKARSWLLASFQGVQAKHGWSIRAIKDAKDSDSVSYLWECDFNTVCKHGPLDGYSGSSNQSVFLRGYRIALRDPLLRTLLPAAYAIPLNTPAEDSWLLRFLNWVLSKLSHRNSELIHHPKLSPPFHYTDIINSHLLNKNPDASVAITHDSDWTKLFGMGELELERLSQEGYLIQFLSNKNCFSLHNGIVYFLVDGKNALRLPLSYHLHSDNLGGGNQSREGMADSYDSDSQTVIDCIRNDRSATLPDLEPYLVANPRSQTSRLGPEDEEPTDFTGPSLHDNSRTIITRIRGDQFTPKPEQTPSECYVLIQFGDVQRRTKNRHVTVGEATEWDDTILLPSELSTILRISVRQFVTETAKEEILHSVELTVEELLDYSQRGDLVLFPLEGKEASEPDCPSLLVITERKIWGNSDDSLHTSLMNCRSREESLLLAKAAKGDERWEDVVNHMKDIARFGKELTSEERDLFSLSYKNLSDAHRATLKAILSAEQEEESNSRNVASFKHHREKLEAEIVKICRDFLVILDSYLIPSAISTESMIFCCEMVGDYNRCLSDFGDGINTRSIQKSMEAYEDALELATSTLRPTHPIRLRLSLNLALFYHEILHCPDKALDIGQKALDSAYAISDKHSGEDNDDSLLTIQYLCESMARWKLDAKEKLDDGRNGGENIENVQDVQTSDYFSSQTSNQDRPLGDHPHPPVAQGLPNMGTSNPDAKTENDRHLLEQLPTTDAIAPASETTRKDAQNQIHPTGALCGSRTHPPTDSSGSSSSRMSWSSFAASRTLSSASRDLTVPHSPADSSCSGCSIDSLPDILSLTIDILGVARQMADIRHIPMLQGIIGTVLRIAQLIQEMDGTHHAIMQVIESSAWLLNEITQYVQRSKLSKGMKRALDSFQQEMNNLHKVVTKISKRGPIARFLLHEADIRAITACTASINVIYDKLEVTLAMDDRQAIARLEAQLTLLRENIESRQCRCGVLPPLPEQSNKHGQGSSSLAQTTSLEVYSDIVPPLPRLRAIYSLQRMRVISLLLRLNKQMETNAVDMVHRFVQDFDFKSTTTDKGTEYHSIPEGGTESDHIGLILGSFLRSRPQEVSLSLHIVFRAYLSAILGVIPSVHALESRHSDLIFSKDKTFSEATSGHQHSQAHPYNLHDGIDDPEPIVERLIMDLSNTILVAGCATPQSDVVSKIRTLFEEKITSLVGLAMHLRNMATSNGFEVLFVQPGDSFDREIMEDVTGGQAVVQDALVACATHLGLLEQMPPTTEKKRAIIKSSVLLRSSLMPLVDKTRFTNAHQNAIDRDSSTGVKGLARTRESSFVDMAAETQMMEGVVDGKLGPQTPIVQCRAGEPFSPSLPTASLASPAYDLAPPIQLYPPDLSEVPGRSAVDRITQNDHQNSIDKHDIVIAVMGLTGSGKSSFVNTAAGKTEVVVGDKLRSQTRAVQSVRCLHPDGLRSIILVDTPGFDDTTLTDAQVLRITAHWLQKTYRNSIKLSGILYLHRISDVRVGGTPLRNLSVFKDLCGEDNMKNIVLVTTMWDQVQSVSIGSEREEQLCTNFWQNMVRLGARTCRFEGTRESAWEIIDQLDLEKSRQMRKPLQIQEEIIDRNMQFHETTAAKTLIRSLSQLAGDLQKGWDKLRKRARRITSPKKPSSDLRTRTLSRRFSSVRLNSSAGMIQSLLHTIAEEQPPLNTERFLEVQGSAQEVDKNIVVGRPSKGKSKQQPQSTGKRREAIQMSFQATEPNSVTADLPTKAKQQPQADTEISAITQQPPRVTETPLPAVTLQSQTNDEQRLPDADLEHPKIARAAQNPKEPLARGNIEDLEMDDSVIAVMGPIGSGKSTFIRAASGSNARIVSRTSKSPMNLVQATRFWDQESGRHVVLVDTPGVDNTSTSDVEVLDMISDWLDSSYKNGKLFSGVLYLHRITDNRIPGTPLKNLGALQKLCGKDALDKVWLVTTMWDEVDPSEGERKLAELTHENWKTTIDRGAMVACIRYDNSSPKQIVQQVLDRDAIREGVLLQEEMVNLKRVFEEAEDGQELCSRLEKLVERQIAVLRRANKERTATLDVSQSWAEIHGAHDALQAQIDSTFFQMQELTLSQFRALLHAAHPY